MKKIPSAPGYFITESGRIFSRVGRFPGQRKLREITVVLGKGGYWKVRLHVQGKRTKKSVHRLVAEAFLENPHRHPIVRHLDDNKNNNHVSNLSWGTVDDNAKDRVQNGRTTRGRKLQRKRPFNWKDFHKTKLNPEIVSEIRRSFRPGIDTFTEVGKRYGVTFQTIRGIIYRTTWKQFP